MTKYELKNFLYESVMDKLENRNRTKEAEKLLNDVVDFEEEFCKEFSDEKKKEYISLTLKYALFHGCETCDEIKFAINFVVDLLLAIK